MTPLLPPTPAASGNTLFLILSTLLSVTIFFQTALPLPAPGPLDLLSWLVLPQSWDSPFSKSQFTSHFYRKFFLFLPCWDLASLPVIYSHCPLSFFSKCKWGRRKKGREFGNNPLDYSRFPGTLLGNWWFLWRKWEYVSVYWVFMMCWAYGLFLFSEEPYDNSIISSLYEETAVQRGWSHEPRVTQLGSALRSVTAVQTLEWLPLWGLFERSLLQAVCWVNWWDVFQATLF